MRYYCAGLLALACAGAQAATYELSLTNSYLTVRDMTPVDQFLPTYTADAAGLLGLLTPVEIHEKGSLFEDNTVLPPSTGPRSGYITGTLGPGTELIWQATGRMKVTVLDTDDYWDFDGIGAQATFYSNTNYDPSWGSSTVGAGLSGYSGSYQRFTLEFDIFVDIHATNSSDFDQWYEMGWSNQYLISSFSSPRPIPEPSTYALMLCGLGAVGLLRRKRSPSTAS